MYLRQQRRQLDESRRLLERLERAQQAGVPLTSHIDTAESGTLPSFVHDGAAKPSDQVCGFEEWSSHFNNFSVKILANL